MEDSFKSKIFCLKEWLNPSFRSCQVLQNSLFLRAKGIKDSEWQATEASRNYQINNIEHIFYSSKNFAYHKEIFSIFSRLKPSQELTISAARSVFQSEHWFLTPVGIPKAISSSHTMTMLSRWSTTNCMRGILLSSITWQRIGPKLMEVLSSTCLVAILQKLCLNSIPWSVYWTPVEFNLDRWLLLFHDNTQLRQWSPKNNGWAFLGGFYEKLLWNPLKMLHLRSLRFHNLDLDGLLGLYRIKNRIPGTKFLI